MSESILPGEPEAFSLFDGPLYRTPLRPETLDQQTKLYRVPWGWSPLAGVGYIAAEADLKRMALNP
jgi:hypothetical protein